MCGSVVLLDCRPFFIAPQSVWVALNDDDAFPFDDGKIFKKVAKGACNFQKTVYSMSSYR